MTFNNDTTITAVSWLSMLIEQRSTEYNNLSTHAVKSANSVTSVGRPLPGDFTCLSFGIGVEAIWDLQKRLTDKMTFNNI